ncbi:MAG TPA: transglycosylase SLT domain-containing protein [Dehalococcoidia bacterium]|nr:transglycosylase SLT domain-containing protein [Dehalococcoidia bacterium]
MTPRLLTPLAFLLICVSACVETDQDTSATPGADATSSAGASATPGGDPSPTATISLTPRPNAPPAEPAAAHRLEAEGELQQALEAYLSISASGAPNRAEGVYGAARVLLQMERPAEARTLLEPFLASASPAEAGPGRYLLARAYAALSMYAEALQQYDLYVKSGRAGLPYAYLDRARILMDFGQPLAAASEAQTGLAAGVPAAARSAFNLVTAQAYEKAGAFGDALRAYQVLFESSPGDQPLALSRMAAIKAAQGNTAAANDDLVRLMAGYPTTQLALDTVKDFEARGVAVDGYIRDLVYYRHNDYARAEPALRERINAAPESPSSAEAYYFLAAILESKGDTAGAQTLYSKVVSLNPQSSLADDALWWRGRILEDEGKRADAQAVYNLIAQNYPQSSWAADAAFRRGMLSYRASDHRQAANIWGEGIALVSDAMERQRLTFWQAKALLQAGDRAAAEPILRELAASGEDDYYGVRAVALLAGDHNQPKADRDSRANLTPDFDWAAAEAWLTAKTGRAVVPPSAQAWSSDPRWSRAQELWLVGRVGQGNAEMFDLIEAYARDGIAMYTMARVLWDKGQFSLSARAGQRLLRVLNTNPNAGLPKALMSLSYPAPFAASLQRYASAERISPLLLLAFIRQESFFDPGAASPVAFGLTQLLPQTAASVAGRLGLPPPRTEDLYRADLNLRLGANYMATQLKDFGDNIFVAFAAYNAGPNAARRWLAAAGSDADMYLETIEYRETRLYVEIVAENYAIYRYIYAGHRVPELPAD